MGPMPREWLLFGLLAQPPRNVAQAFRDLRRGPVRQHCLAIELGKLRSQDLDLPRCDDADLDVVFAHAKNANLHVIPYAEGFPLLSPEHEHTR